MAKDMELELIVTLTGSVMIFLATGFSYLLLPPLKLKALENSNIYFQEILKQKLKDLFLLTDYKSIW